MCAGRIFRNGFDRARSCDRMRSMRPQGLLVVVFVVAAMVTV